MNAFRQRLHSTMQAGNLRVADLARWFDRPHATVRGWVEDGTEPGGGPLDRAMVMALMRTLEHLVKKKRGFPVPRLSPSARIAHLAKIRTEIKRA